MKKVGFATPPRRLLSVHAPVLWYVPAVSPPFLSLLSKKKKPTFPLLLSFVVRRRRRRRR